MAGFRSDFVYTSDEGTKYVVYLDLTNCLTQGFGFQEYSNDPVLPRPPRYLKYRYVLAQAPQSGLRRRFPVGSTTCAIWMGTQNTFTGFDYNTQSAVQFEVLRRFPEKVRFLPRPTMVT